MDVIEIDNAAELERLQPEWSALWDRTPSAEPFQHPDWLLPWSRHIGRGDLTATAIRDGSDLVGLAPFYVHSEDGTGRRQLTLLGNGITDRCDVLLDRSRADVVGALARTLSASRARWNAYDFRDLPANSVLIPIMREMTGGIFTEDEPCVVAGLEDWALKGDRALSKRHRADLRRCRNRADELGRVRTESAEGQSVAGATEALFSLHTSRWRARGQDGVLVGAGVEAFHLEVAERFARRGWLRLYCLYIGDRIAAANYGFSVRQRSYFYIGGFDPEFARLGVGGILLREVICRAAAEGALEFDFLRGDEEYKLRWGGGLRRQYRVHSLPLPRVRGPELATIERLPDAQSAIEKSTARELKPTFASWNGAASFSTTARSSSRRSLRRRRARDWSLSRRQMTSLSPSSGLGSRTRAGHRDGGHSVS